MKKPMLFWLCALIFLALSCSKDDNLAIPETDQLARSPEQIALTLAVRPC
ncbi:MAG: hypothetical protein IPJ40_21195 [Saprospirales bacterium]|nr:hypothetical protein [Saprospirales bacterium]